METMLDVTKKVKEIVQENKAEKNPNNSDRGERKKWLKLRMLDNLKSYGHFISVYRIYEECLEWAAVVPLHQILWSVVFWSAPCSCGLLILVLKSGSRSLFDSSRFVQTLLSLSSPNVEKPRGVLAFCSVMPNRVCKRMFYIMMLFTCCTRRGRYVCGNANWLAVLPVQ